MLNSFCLLNVCLVLTLLFLQHPDNLQLLDYRGEGIGDDRDHDEEGEEEDDQGWQDLFDILEQYLNKVIRNFQNIFKSD